MGETRKIVVEGYPVENLPDDLRQRLGATGVVTVTIEAAPLSLASFIGSAPGLYPKPEDAVNAIRRLRDETDR